MELEYKIFLLCCFESNRNRTHSCPHGHFYFTVLQATSSLLPLNCHHSDRPGWFSRGILLRDVRELRWHWWWLSPLWLHVWSALAGSSHSTLTLLIHTHLHTHSMSTKSPPYNDLPSALTPLYKIRGSICITLYILNHTII
jgi:hypothetical protein